jgi:hypothetical protein
LSFISVQIFFGHATLIIINQTVAHHIIPALFILQNIKGISIF